MVAVQPLFFHLVMEKAPAEGWQIVQEGQNHLRVFVLNPEPAFDEKALSNSLVDGLAEIGVGEVFVEVDYPSALRRNSIGKVIMIKAMECPTAAQANVPASREAR